MELFSDVVPKYLSQIHLHFPPTPTHSLLSLSGLQRISVSCAPENTGSTRDRRVTRAPRSIGEPILVLNLSRFG